MHDRPCTCSCQLMTMGMPAGQCSPQAQKIRRCLQAMGELRQSSRRTLTWLRMAVHMSSSRLTDQVLDSNCPWQTSLEDPPWLTRMRRKARARALDQAGRLGEETAGLGSLPPSGASHWRCCRRCASWLDATSFPASKVRTGVTSLNESGKMHTHCACIVFRPYGHECICPSKKQDKRPAGASLGMLQRACILAGCNFLLSIKGAHRGHTLKEHGKVHTHCACIVNIPYGVEGI